MKWIPVFLAATLFAADPCCTPNCCPEGALNAPSCSCKQYAGQYGTLFPATPCIDSPCSPCGMFWTADVSVLAWQAREEGLNFALKNDPLPISADVNVNGHLVGIDFNWEPAVKVTLGAAFPERAWDAQIRWTYFHTDSSSTYEKATSVASAGLLPLWAFPSADVATQFLYGKAEGSLDLNLNEFDIEMGYNPFLSPALSLRFTAGLKVAKIDQDFHVNYSEGFSDIITELTTAQAALTNKAIGAGPRIGFDSKWRVGSGFSLLASIAGSLPLWHYRVTRTDASSGFGGRTPQTVESFFKERFWTFRSILETSLGLGWDTCFGCRCQFPFGVAASYEFQYFADQNMMAMLVNPGVLYQVYHTRGDLSLHGATLNFHFGF
jgi:hypothetical protein